MALAHPDRDAVADSAWARGRSIGDLGKASYCPHIDDMRARHRQGLGRGSNNHNSGA